MSWLNMDKAVKSMAGRRIASIGLSDDREILTFRFMDGHEQSFGVEGDCCSRSWIEHLEAPDDVIGAEFTEYVSGGSVEDDDKYNPIIPGKLGYHGQPDREHECLKVYQDTFRTSRGDIVLEYRNSSNGYYGGWLEPRG
jgi:hypothetical protein